MRRGIELGKWWRPVIGAAAVTVLLGGCSSVPNAVNPVKWYEGTVDFFSGDDEDEQAAEAEPVPGADEPFPSLGTVPEKPKTSSAKEREEVAEGLVADREKRRYGSAVERQGAPANVLGSVPETPTPEPMPSSVPSLPKAPEPMAPTTSSSPSEPPGPLPESPSSAPATEPSRQQSMDATPPPSPQVSMEAPALPETRTARTETPTPPPEKELTPPPEIPERLTRPAAPPANAMMPMSDENETVVISSDGVQSTRPIAAQSAPRFAAAQTGAPTAPEGMLRVATIQFAFGSSQLDSRDRAILKQVVALQKERGGVIRVVGHASARTANMDPVQHKVVNYDISEERAQAVAEMLVQLGAPADGVVSEAKAETDPVFYEFMPSGEAGNRRTEVYLDF